MTHDDPTPTPDTSPWAPDLRDEEDRALESAIYQAVGAASMAWENAPTGMFDTAQARRIGEGLLAFVQDYRAAHPIGLTVSEDGNLLNWLGENYVRQSVADSVTDNLRAQVEGLQARVQAQRLAIVASQQSKVTPDSPWPDGQREHAQVAMLGRVVATRWDVLWVDPADGYTPEPIATAERRGGQWYVESRNFPDGRRPSLRLPDADSFTARLAAIAAAEVLREYLMARVDLSDSTTAALEGIAKPRGQEDPGEDFPTV